MGTSSMFVFGIVSIIGIIFVLGLMQITMQPDIDFSSQLMLINVEAPKMPNFDMSNPFAFLSSTASGLAYLAALGAYVIILGVNVSLLPAQLVSIVWSFTIKYPYITMIIGVITAILLYSIFARIFGGD